MSEIMTVCGPLKPEKLGFTHTHEHILVDLSFYAEQNQEFFPPLELTPQMLECRMENLNLLRNGFHAISEDCMTWNDEEDVEAEIMAFRNAGGQSMVEVSPAGIRGDVRGLKRLSEKTEVNIIASTGLYGEGSWPKACQHMSQEELEEFFESEIYNGIDGTNIKAGLVKIACNTMSEDEMKALRAGARVAAKTGRLLQVHTGVLLSIDNTKEMVEIVLNEGLAPDRLLMCHLDGYVLQSELLSDYILDFENATKLNLAPMRDILNKGVNISFDNFGFYWGFEVAGYYSLNDYDRIRGLLALIKEGYSGQITLGTDFYVKLAASKYGGPGYNRILDFVVPTLSELEIPEEDINKMTISNPARLLAY